MSYGRPPRQDWVSVTSAGLERWIEALQAYRSIKWDYRTERDRAAIIAARKSYREWILGWWWKLCAPLRPGETCPNEVAELLAEEWDLLR